MENTTIETQSDKTRKVSVSFNRKVGLPDYSNVEVFVYVEDEVGSDASDAEVSEVAVNLLNAAKSAAFDSLGLEAFIDDNGVLREKHEPKATVKAASDALGRELGGTPMPADHGIRIMNERDLKPGETIPAGVVARCQELGITAVWANEGQYGRFWKEAVARGESPKLPDQRDPSKGGIIKA